MKPLATIERVDIANALAVQQSLDAVAVSRALRDQAITFTGAALAILIFNRRDVDDAADPRLARQIGEERPHQLLQIDPVGLGAPGTTVHFDAGRVDLMIDDALSRQPSVQPMAVQACFAAPPDMPRNAKRVSASASTTASKSRSMVWNDMFGMSRSDSPIPRPSYRTR
jgi:hypothetical protein